MLFRSAFFATFAAIYYWFPKMFGRMMSEWLGQLHFWLTFVFMHVTFLPMFTMGLMGHHRRIANPEFFDILRTPEMERLQWIATIGAIRFGFEICLDHALGMLRQTPPLKPTVPREPRDIHIVTSAAVDRKSTRLNSSHSQQSRMPSSA